MTTSKPAVGKFERKGTSRKYTHLVDGQTIITTCKVFGGVLHDENGNFTASCADCLQTNEVREACQIASGIKPVTFAEIMASSKVRKSSGKKDGKTAVIKDDSVFISYVKAFKNNKSKPEIIALMLENGLTENASKTLFSKLSCVTGAILRPNLKDSTIYQVARFIVHSSGVAPIGDKSSIAFCSRVCNAWIHENSILKRDI